MKQLTATVLLLLLSAMIAVAEEPRPISFPCPCCHYSTVVEVSTGVPYIVEEATGQIKITKMKRTCEGCGYEWYGCNSEYVRRTNEKD